MGPRRSEKDKLLEGEAKEIRGNSKARSLRGQRYINYSKVKPKRTENVKMPKVKPRRKENDK